MTSANLHPVCPHCDGNLTGRYITLDTPTPTTYVLWCSPCQWATTLDGRHIIVAGDGTTEPVWE